MKVKFFIGVFILVVFLPSCKKEVVDSEEVVTHSRPFPHHTQYTGSHITPSNYSATELDGHTQAFFNQWVSTYVKNDCQSDEYYIYSGDGAHTVSEAHGYGMMIMCLMSSNAHPTKSYFDGMFRYYQAHPSIINNHLMDWQQQSCNDSASDGDDAASDGDIDIAYALLLADTQWGSAGAIDYLSEAQVIIDAIMQDEINPITGTVKLGDWCDTSDPNYFFGTRPSDFITDHFKVFATTTGNEDWNGVVDACYNLIDIIQSNTSAATGLMPDFIVQANTVPQPAGAYYLEDTYDGDYYYNACRFPWRIGTDYLMTGDSRALTAVQAINSWMFEVTNNDVSTISNGYLLDGTPIYDWHDATFVGPLAVGAMMDVANPVWLNNLYDDLLLNNDLSDGDYYSNTIKLLSMIVLSENYWNP